MAPPPVSVVIATRDRRPLLERTLDALAAQTASELHVVVVDDGSSDDTWPWLAARTGGPELIALRQEHRGQGVARNLALREVRDGLVLFLGDDVIPRPDLVTEHLVAHGRCQGGWAVVGFTDWRRSEMRVTPLLEMVNREGHQFGYGRMTAGAEVPFSCFYTSNVSLPRALLGDEPFDPAFRAYGWEDVELGYRLSRRGVRLLYHEAARAEHLHPTDLRRFFGRQRLVGRGVHALLRLHPELAGSPHLSPLEPPRWFPLARWLVPPLVPLLSVVDRMGIALGTRFLHAVLMTGYYLGADDQRDLVVGCFW